jgi:hypothetical protein
MRVNLDLLSLVPSSHLFDVFQLKCIPGSTQECPEPQFGRNDDETCFPKTLVNGE